MVHGQALGIGTITSQISRAKHAIADFYALDRVANFHDDARELPPQQDVPASVRASNLAKECFAGIDAD